MNEYGRFNGWYWCAMGPGRGSPNISETEWKALYQSALHHARALTKSEVAAEEVTQEAMLRLFTTRTFDSERGVPLKMHLARIVRSVASHRWSSVRAELGRFPRAETDPAVLRDDEGTPSAEGRTPSAEEMHRTQAVRIHEQEVAAAALTELTRRLSAWPLELAILSATLEGITKPAAQAAHTHRSIEDVYAARRRIQRYAQAVEAPARSKEELSS